MRTYKITNDVVGWLVFAIAAFTYCSTIEPTASFWDCPEFITTAAKMEIGHPPGAPFFMLLGNLFSHFASDASQIAKMVNMMSAILSAGCILFLFWSITHLAKKLVCEDEESMTKGQLIAIIAAGVGGSLIYTWSDTFWFSAVEGEVYAFSSFLTALVFWLILKWENRADEPGSDRWLILIAYLVGLSIGVHLLNLLCIPAMVLVYYYKKQSEPTLKGSLLALCVSALIVAAVLYGVVPGIGKVAGWFELLFVNTLAMPFNTGLYIYLALLIASLVWAVIETARGNSKKRMNIAFLLSVALLGIPFYGYGVGCVVVGIIILAFLAYLVFKTSKVTQKIMNTTVLCMALMFIGYSCYAIIVIRSTANPPMDQNSPEDVFTLGEYLSREQYGDRPLFWGPTYASQINVIETSNGDLMYETKEGAPVYQRKEKDTADEPDKYIITRHKFEYKYPLNQCMLFPRIYSDDKANSYKMWLGDVPTKTVDYTIPTQGTRQITIPTQAANLQYFFSYQLNFMYWRYFMWNFVGRQNDIQSDNGWEHGNWITGIKFLDNARLGNQDLLPSDLKNNKGHNVFYCLPLLLGLFGFFWQAFKGKKGIQQFWIVFFLFFMTGIAIVIYLNQVPDQPRERDYAYAGSFYAFSIWCGLGVTAIYDWFIKALKNKKSASLLAASISVIPAVAIPLQMVSQTWDDHDRSDRYVCRDFGLNYLETIPHDGIIFTNGDNDTFPLWYNEDTEGNRTDVRVCNLSYLQTDWYIDQMKRPAYEGNKQSSPLPISWNRLQYTTGRNESIDVNPGVEIEGQYIKIKDLIRQVYTETPDMAKELWGEDPFELRTAIDKFVLKKDIPEKYKPLVDNLPSCLPSDTLHVTVDKTAVRKSGMIIPGDSIPDQMVIDLSDRSHVYKSFMMMLEMIAESNFSRPIYMSTTVGPDNYGNLFKHFIQEGIAWRITPFTFADNQKQQTICDSEKMYDNMMNKYHYGNLSQKGLYIDETTQRMCFTHRRWFSVLITALVQEGKLDKALNALEKCDKEIPSYNVPYDISNGSLDLADAYWVCGKKDKAEKIYSAIIQRCKEYIVWYMSLPNYKFASVCRECFSEISSMAAVQQSYESFGQQDKAEHLMDEINIIYSQFAPKAESVGFSLQTYYTR